MLFIFLKTEVDRNGKENGRPLEEGEKRAALFIQRGVQERHLRDAKTGGCDESGGGGTQAVENPLHGVRFAEARQHRIDDRDDDERGGREGERREDAARNAKRLKTGVGRHIDAQRPRGGL